VDSITFQKLRDLEERFKVLEAQMSDPAIVQDPPHYQRLARVRSCSFSLASTLLT
jgi:hypothetical protein